MLSDLFKVLDDARREGSFHKGLVILFLWLGFFGYSNAEERSLLLQSTTSTVNSGLLENIIPKFTEKTGIDVKVISSGTGQALRNAKNGDADVVLVHSKLDEEKFVQSGFGVERIPIMYNDFVIIGPPHDPAGVGKTKTASDAFRKIWETQSFFVSRGDDSGTHKREIRLWKAVSVDHHSISSSDWYMETGSGMGAALNIAVNNEAYILSDRGTWINFRNKRGHKILFQKTKELLNEYSAILVNSKRHSHVKSAEGQALIDWLIDQEGQSAIDAYRINGEQLFFSSNHELF